MKFRKIASIVVVLLIFFFLFTKIHSDFEYVKNIKWQLGLTHTVTLAVVLLTGPFINAFSWHLYTKAIGGNINFLDNLRIWTLSNAARFLPGSIWQYAGRVYMLSQKGISKTFTTTALFLEALFNVGVASLIVLSVLRILPGVPVLLQKSLIPIIFLLCVAVVLLTSQGTRFIKVLIKKIANKDIVEINNIQTKWLPGILISVATQFLFTGLALYFISLGLGVRSPETVLPYIGIYAASWLVGYLAFLAPSGLGLREASMAGLMSLYIPIALGGLIAILFRIATMVSEAIMVGVVLAFTRKKTGP